MFFVFEGVGVFAGEVGYLWVFVFFAFRLSCVRMRGKGKEERDRLTERERK